jgi:hypothetical protein
MLLEESVLGYTPALYGTALCSTLHRAWICTGSHRYIYIYIYMRERERERERGRERHNTPQ